MILNLFSLGSFFFLRNHPMTRLLLCVLHVCVCACVPRRIFKRTAESPMADQMTVAIIRTEQNRKKTLMENHWLSRHTQTLTRTHTTWTQKKKKSTICQGNPKKKLGGNDERHHYFSQKYIGINPIQSFSYFSRNLRVMFSAFSLFYLSLFLCSSMCWCVCV